MRLVLGTWWSIFGWQNLSRRSCIGKFLVQGFLRLRENVLFLGLCVGGGSEANLLVDGQFGKISQKNLLFPVWLYLLTHSSMLVGLKIFIEDYDVWCQVCFLCFHVRKKTTRKIHKAKHDRVCLLEGRNPPHPQPLLWAPYHTRKKVSTFPSCGWGVVVLFINSRCYKLTVDLPDVITQNGPE